MLYNFALTPDLFDPYVIQGERHLELAIQEVLHGICENGLAADLHNGQLFGYVRETRMADMAPGLRDNLKALLNVLSSRKRLVPCPLGEGPLPATDDAWFDLAVESHGPQRRFYSLISAPELYTRCAAKCEDLQDLAQVLTSNSWRDRKRTWLINRNPADWTRALQPVLAHAKHIRLVDPFMNCNVNRFWDFLWLVVSLCEIQPTTPSRVTIQVHALDPENPRFKEKREKWENRLRAWQQAFAAKPIAATRRYKLEVYLWDDLNTGHRFHDRFILTDQCGISVPAGLEVEPGAGAGDTDLSLLDEVSRDQRTRDFTVGTSRFRDVGKITVNIG